MLSKQITKKVKQYNQEHLLKFYSKLNNAEKMNLEKQIGNINFSFMKNLYKNSFSDEVIDVSKIDSLKCITSLTNNEKNLYEKIGENLIKNGNYAVVIMAGGNGSRLGYNCPKGCIELDINKRKISLFEIFINQLKEIKEKYNIFINIYIMTSNNNNKETIGYFEHNSYFNYPQENVHFFIQDELPILDINGNILLKDKSNILFGPNGNGNVFNALKKSNMIYDMEKKKIKYILFSTVDNALTNLVDPIFIGATIYNKYNLSSKTLFKDNPLDKDWIFCKYKEKPYMLPTKYISNEIANKLDIYGNYMYRETNITYHLIYIDSVKKFADINLKYHRAYKKSEYINSKGNKISKDLPNSFKFEQFIFDAFCFENDMLLYRTTTNEFCPIKTKNDIIKVSNAISERLNIK